MSNLSYVRKTDNKSDEKSAEIKTADIKLENKSESKKIILLTEVDVDKVDLRELHRNSSVCNFDGDVQFDNNILTIIEQFDVLLIDIRDKKNLKWYALMRSAIEHRDDINVVYLHKKGVPIVQRDHIIKYLAADIIIKELPKKDEYNSKSDFFFKLLSEHIPVARNWYSIFVNLFSYLCCSSDQPEQKKN